MTWATPEYLYVVDFNGETPGGPGFGLHSFFHRFKLGGLPVLVHSPERSRHGFAGNIGRRHKPVGFLTGVANSS